MLILFLLIAAGIAAGRMSRRIALPWLPRLVTVVIWILLALLGAEAGGNEAVVGGLATLGVQALTIAALSIAGSIAAAWLLGRLTGIVRPDAESEGGERRPWRTMRGSLVIVGWFAAGVAAGLCDLLPFDPARSALSTRVLYLLMFSVGVTLGHDSALAERLRSLDRRCALLPLFTAAGTLAGAAAASLWLPVAPADALAVGAGFGYYSLSSILISPLRGAALGTVALLVNILRELFTLLAAPLVARWAGPLAAVSIGGATSFDTTLPVITQAAGGRFAVVALFHGCLLDFSVPFLVTLFCRL